MSNFAIEFGHLTHLLSSFHIQQVRKGKFDDGLKVPYIIHPLQVLQRMQRWGINKNNLEDQDLWKAALFHDVLEDTPITYKFLQDLIGDVAVGLVAELTHDEKTSTKEDYLATFKEKSVESLVIKIADRLCNVDDFIQDNPGYAYRYMLKAGTLLVAMSNRKDEIKERFGELVYDVMSTDFSNTGLRAANKKSSE